MNKRQIGQAMFAGFIVCIFPITSTALSYTAVLLNDQGSAIVTPGAINSSGLVLINEQIALGVYSPYIVDQNGATIRYIEKLGNPDVHALGYGLNDSGQVVGASYTNRGNNNYPPLAFVTGASGESTVGFGNYYSTAYAINNFGQIAGSGDRGPSTYAQAFIANTGNPTLNFIDFNGTLFSTQLPSEATAINDLGQVIGYAYVPTNGISPTSRAFVTGPNGIGVRMLTEGYPTAINNAGQIVGYHYTNQGVTAFTTGSNADYIIDLGTLGGPTSYAYDINNKGQIVGSAQTTDNYLAFSAFIINQSTLEMIDLNNLVDIPNNQHLTMAMGINDAGMIVASTRTATGGGGLIYLLLPNQDEPDIKLPTSINNGVFHFNISNINPSRIIYIDPLVATGYDYATGLGDPNFASLILPNIGDGNFVLDYVFNGQGVQELISHDTQYFFPQGGVNAFRVTGIETSAALNPTNPSAFITGLTFVSQGNFTGTMTPITEFVPGPMIGIPEPDTLSTMFGGMLTFMALASVGRIRCARHDIKLP